MRKFALLCMALVMAAPAAAQSVTAGIDAWQKGEYASAVKIWRPLAEAGDADAAFNLGQAYRLGRGVPINLAAAQTWLLRAAGKDHLDAQTTLGLLLFDSGDRAGGLRWLKAAADRGDPRALLVYGTALFNGDDVPRDPVLAYALVSRAAAQGLAPAKSALEEMDRIIPLAQRKKGVALALAKARRTPAPKPVASKPATVLKATPKPLAPSSAPPTGNWRIQLGAFAQRSSAEALFRKLAASGALGGRSPAFVASGPMTRLQVGPFESRAAAAAACAALSARAQACFPVSAK